MNHNLNSARSAKDDEYYTIYEDIEKEINYYKDILVNKTIYCNCDNPYKSNFVRYFIDNFKELKIKRLIATCYSKESTEKVNLWKDSKSSALKYDSDTNKITTLNGDGDFRSIECLDLLQQADIVITNPPFSLFRQFITLLYDYKKEFLIIGNKNANKSKETFIPFREHRLWLGYTVPTDFVTEDGIKTSLLKGLCRWYTNIDTNKKVKPLELNKEIKEYKKFDYYDAINVDKISDIPDNYFEPIGVPITFLDHYCEEQFELIDSIGRYSVCNNKETREAGNYLSMVDVKHVYQRIIIIKRRKAD